MWIQGLAVAVAALFCVVPAAVPLGLMAFGLTAVGLGGTGVRGALRGSWPLARGAFWTVLGVALLGLLCSGGCTVPSTMANAYLVYLGPSGAVVGAAAMTAVTAVAKLPTDGVEVSRHPRLARAAEDA